MVVLKTPGWSLRWDLSPLGYPATAAHGHLDALHLSVWFRGQPIVIDPGTGAYYADPELRAWLSSRGAHNGPCPEGTRPPVRRGPFLWAAHHAIPQLEVSEAAAVGILNLLECQVRRRVSCVDNEPRTWEVVDSCVAKDGTPAPFSVCWQFAPGSWVKRISARKFSVHRADAAVMMDVDQSWTAVELVELAEPVADAASSPAPTLPAPRRMEGLVSPAFRSVVRAPYLRLFARPPRPAPCVFRTTFQACGA
jgi:hypothetical protein